jgi:hypothetical protein
MLKSATDQAQVVCQVDLDQPVLLFAYWLVKATCHKFKFIQLIKGPKCKVLPAVNQPEPGCTVL